MTNNTHKVQLEEAITEILRSTKEMNNKYDRLHSQLQLLNSNLNKVANALQQQHQILHEDIKKLPEQQQFSINGSEAKTDLEKTRAKLEVDFEKVNKLLKIVFKQSKRNYKISIIAIILLSVPVLFWFWNIIKLLLK